MSKYIIIKKLGEGAAGVVYKAVKCDGTKEIVALKVLKCDTIQKRAALQKEIVPLTKLAQACRNYTVCYHETFTRGDKCYLVMDYIPGGVDLVDYLGKIPLKSSETIVGREDRTDYAVNLIKGLSEIHRAGIAHQDLKEENVMWDFVQGVPRYIDFGGVCDLEKDCQGSISAECRAKVCSYKGTEHAYPPETLENRFRNAIAHDVWSLGVILFNWYTVPDELSKEVTEWQASVTPLRDWKDSRLQKEISTIKNTFIQEILQLLLEKDPVKRLENWSRVQHLATLIEPVGFDRTEQTAKVYMKTIVEPVLDEVGETQYLARCANMPFASKRTLELAEKDIYNHYTLADLVVMLQDQDIDGDKHSLQDAISLLVSRIFLK